MIEKAAELIEIDDHVCYAIYDTEIVSHVSVATASFVVLFPVALVLGLVAGFLLFVFACKRCWTKVRF